MPVLIINICKEPLHYYEFVKPIEDILNKNGIKFLTKDYDKISNNNLLNSSRIIICGTSLNDNEFLEDLQLFSEILKVKKPILGICGGMEILGVLLGATLKERKEIGFHEIKFTKDFLSIQKETTISVYQLHKLYVDLSEILDKVEITSKSYDLIPQSIKHKSLPIYGVLFHPEVRNHEIILDFCKI